MTRKIKRLFFVGNEEQKHFIKKISKNIEKNESSLSFLPVHCHSGIEYATSERFVYFPCFKIKFADLQMK